MRGLHVHGGIVAAIGVLAVLAQGTPATPIVGLLLLGSMIFYGIKGNALTLEHHAQKGWVRDGEAELTDSSLLAKPEQAALQSGGGPSTFVKVLAIGAAILVGLVIIGLIAEPSDPNQITSSADAELGTEEIREPMAERVTATELYRAYEANEQAAQIRYGNHPLEISGRITSIELDFLDQPVVSLEAGSLFAEVTLRFTSDHANVTAQLVRGEPFLARCETLTEILGAPQLEDCIPL